MSITIGRAGKDGTTIPAPLTITYDGDQVKLEGLVSDTTANAQVLLLWLRDQIVNSANNIDEPVVPVACTEASQIDGFYTVVAASAVHERGGIGGSVQWLRWAVTLQRAPWWRLARIELPMVYGVLTNSLSITLGRIMIGLPASSTDIWGGYTITYTPVTRTGADGTSLTHYLAPNVSGAGSATFSFQSTPAHFYDGASYVEMDVSLGSGVWRRVVGRRSFTTAEIPYVRLVNGMARLSLDAATLQYWQTEHWDGSQWDTPLGYMFDRGNANKVLAHAAQIIRNGPEGVTIRYFCHWTTQGANDGRAYVDVTLRRGSRWMFCVLYSDITNSFFRCAFRNASASTTSTGYLRETSDNAAGNRNMIATPTASTYDAVNGAITTATQTGTTGHFFVFGLGCEVGGSGAGAAGAENTASAQAEEFFMASSETTRVVGG